jgi:hypothetical protein
MLPHSCRRRRKIATFRRRNRPSALRVSEQMRRVEVSMADKRTDGYIGALLGGLVAIAAVAFLLSGGEWGGKKKVEGDEDLPPVVSTTKK